MTPFPWSALPRVARRGVEAARRARHVAGLGGNVPLAAVTRAAGSLLGEPIEITASGPAELGELPESEGVRVVLGTDAPEIVLDLEDALAVRAAGNIVGKKITLVDPTKRPSPEIGGALAALAVAVARRVGARGLRVHGVPSTEPWLRTKLDVLVGRDSFVAWGAVSARTLPSPRPFDRAALLSLGDVPIGLRAVAAQCRARLGELDALARGGILCPGDAWTIALARTAGGDVISGEVALAGKLAETGLRAAVVHWLGRAPGLVLTPGSTSLPWDARMNDDSRPKEPNAATPEALAEAEIVVRVEVATVTMTARAWAALSAGDVVATGLRLGEPVTLRAGGVAFARGELCDLDGELAVRVLSREGDER